MGRLSVPKEKKKRSSDSESANGNTNGNAVHGAQSYVLGGCRFLFARIDDD
jgi:hypothetical protein